MKKIKLMAMILGMMLMPSLASAACSSPVGSGAEGEYYYNSSTKAAYYCNGTSWVAMGTAGAWQDKPTVGANGGSVVTLCNVDVGKPCGGGYYIGDGNLVITPPMKFFGGPTYVGCLSPASSASDCEKPVCVGSTCKHSSKFVDDSDIHRQWNSRGVNANTFGYQGSRRYGYQQGNRADVDTQFNTNDPMRYCKDLVYPPVASGETSYSDWYLPNSFEVRFIGSNGYKTGGFNPTMRYYGSALTYPWGSSVGSYSVSNDSDGQIGTVGHSTAESTGESWNFRCVRRN